MHKIQFSLTEEEYQTIKEGKGKNTWKDFCLSHPFVRDYIQSRINLKQLQDKTKAVK